MINCLRGWVSGKSFTEDMGVGARREGRVEFHQIEERLFPERIALVKGMAGTMVQGRHWIS